MTDPKFRNSGKERRTNERYFTETWVTEALMRRLPMCSSFLSVKTIWEPAYGRGDMAQVLEGHGYEVLGSDIDLSDAGPSIETLDFLTETPWWRGGFEAIITNPPYGGERKTSLAEMFVRRALEYPEAKIIAMLLRAEFSYADGRTDLFDRLPFAFEIRLTSRPRWDWWLPEDERGEHGGFHNYSWFVWDRAWTGAPTVVFENKVSAEDRAAKRTRRSKGKSMIAADAELNELLNGAPADLAQTELDELLRGI